MGQAAQSSGFARRTVEGVDRPPGQQPEVGRVRRDVARRPACRSVGRPTAADQRLPHRVALLGGGRRRRPRRGLPPTGATNSGINSGGSCRSLNSTMAASPRAKRQPAARDASTPKSRLKRTYRQRRSRAQTAAATAGAVRAVVVDDQHLVVVRQARQDRGDFVVGARQVAPPRSARHDDGEERVVRGVVRGRLLFIASRPHRDEVLGPPTAYRRWIPTHRTTRPSVTRVSGTRVSRGSRSARTGAMARALSREDPQEDVVHAQALQRSTRAGPAGTAMTPGSTRRRPRTTLSISVCRRREVKAVQAEVARPLAVGRPPRTATGPAVPALAAAASAGCRRASRETATGRRPRRLFAIARAARPPRRVRVVPRHRDQPGQWPRPCARTTRGRASVESPDPASTEKSPACRRRHVAHLPER